MGNPSLIDSGGARVLVSHGVGRRVLGRGPDGYPSELRATAKQRSDAGK